VIMAWVNLAMAAILQGMFGIPARQVLFYVALALAITALYSAASGLWGVAVTDVFQFVLAMLGTVVLAFVVLGLPQVGGIAGLTARLPEWSLRLTPEIGGAGGGAAGGALALTATAFAAFLGVQWWAAWYPGSEPGGGGYVAQRMMSAKDERHSLLATLWFTIAHYCVRPWPWILVGLATLVLYPDLPADQKRLGYVFAMRDHLPSGLKGLLVAAFFAAYMSTISTQLNWGTSYVVNDVYRRFVKPSASERDLVRLSRLCTLGLMAVSLGVTALMETISGAWAFIIEAGAGLGLVLILRWFWWRINAWSEIVAMLAAAASYAVVKHGTDIPFPQSLFPIVGATTVAWLVATWLTPATDEARLVEFYRRVHPGGPGWARIARLVPEVPGDGGFSHLFAGWAAGVVLVYAALFATGALLLGRTGEGLACVALAALAAVVVGRVLRHPEVALR